MSEMEERLNALLSNPQLMQQIASMAQAMGSSSPEPLQSSPPEIGLDPKLIQSMAGVLGNTGVDSNQKALLHALSPYISSYRVQKLERAMQAAKLAGAASGFLNAGGLQMLTGR
jgi:hypothetical protein